MKALVPMEVIEQKILLIQGEKVILDKDLAALYGVTTSNLNKAVNRNIERFPKDFMVQLTAEELQNLKFHFGTSSWGGTRKPPRAFTEQGVAMLSSVLRSKQAIEVNIMIMRTFVKLRRMISTHKDLARKLADLEKKYDSQFKVVFDALRNLISEPEPKEKKIGFIKESRAIYRTTRQAGRRQK